MPRLFTALEVPHNIASSLSLVRGGLPGARWLENGDLHITLNFFGDVEAHIADEIVHALDRVELPCFNLRLRGLDVFTRKKPSTLYAGLEANPALMTLHETIGRKLRHLPLERNKRSFTPHITLAHVRQSKIHDLIKYLTERGGFLTDTFEAKRFVLMSSRELVGGGPYIIEESWPLHQSVMAVKAATAL
ncbi:RNA 2',3'-cyclic phosphodiesterase [Bartonella sp. HY329]|uniref:RNA 2',3'-cyclic phosphodiesterase n=1 Tax=unclassified Bartonella TaxID=2645622 RepID=UPI0021C59A1F|nr:MULTISPECIES: RNA 2',3'-cyclic phosphodiesterase [unclassified Bartonella]UXM95212.1 RNA 2',3'-cyclic phosphodiesterase [Bartonella sp. HY329]UXN09535.1 RNA 2',3'-cyclic phosphodiesterase [Bartonella sp. HY328]